MHHMGNSELHEHFILWTNYIPCRLELDVCFDFGDIYKYVLNINCYLIQCKNWDHIENCTNFECNKMFKCFNSYCIPWTYVCDGKWDCLKGSDELHLDYLILRLFVMKMRIAFLEKMKLFG